MSQLVVLKFANEHGAGEALNEIGALQKQHLITLEGAATVVRAKDGKPKVKQAMSLVGAGALGGAFWGMLIGLLFFVPFLGLAAGALGGAIGGKFEDIGIDDDFIKEVGSSIQPGKSAVFLLIREATADRVVEALKAHNPQVIKTYLSAEQEAKLKSPSARCRLRRRGRRSCRRPALPRPSAGPPRPPVRGSPLMTDARLVPRHGHGRRPTDRRPPCFRSARVARRPSGAGWGCTCAA